MDKEDMVYIMEHYAAIKKNEILPFVTTWMDLELCLVIMLSEVSQTEKGKYLSHDFTYMWNSKSKGTKQNKAYRYGEQIGGYQKGTGLGGGRNGCRQPMIW